jgi:hypothetical protein
MGHGFATLGEEQERKLAPEVEEEQQVERPPEMEAETHILYSDLVQSTSLGNINGRSTAFKSAFKSLRCTSSAKLFDLTQPPFFPTYLLVSADFVCTVKDPGLISCNLHIRLFNLL